MLPKGFEYRRKNNNIFTRNSANAWWLYFDNQNTWLCIVYTGRDYRYEIDRQICCYSKLELAQEELIQDYLEFCQDD